MSNVINTATWDELLSEVLRIGRESRRAAFAERDAIPQVSAAALPSDAQRRILDQTFALLRQIEFRGREAREAAQALLQWWEQQDYSALKLLSGRLYKRETLVERCERVLSQFGLLLEGTHPDGEPNFADSYLLVDWAADGAVATWVGSVEAAERIPLHMIATDALVYGGEFSEGDALVLAPLLLSGIREQMVPLPGFESDVGPECAQLRLRVIDHAIHIEQLPQAKAGGESDGGGSLDLEAVLYDHMQEFVLVADQILKARWLSDDLEVQMSVGSINNATLEKVIHILATSFTVAGVTVSDDDVREFLLALIVDRARLSEAERGRQAETGNLLSRLVASCAIAVAQ